MRCSATKEATTSLNEPMRPTLDEALEYVVDDELVEVSRTSLLIFWMTTVWNICTDDVYF